MSEFEQQVEEFLERAIRKSKEPKPPYEKLKEIHRRLNNSKNEEKKKFGL